MTEKRDGKRVKEMHRGIKMDREREKGEVGLLLPAVLVSISKEKTLVCVCVCE